MVGFKVRSSHWCGTPEAWRVEVSGERVRIKRDNNGQPQRLRRNPAKVTVTEPLMQLLDNVMVLEGVSGARLESALGLGKDRLRDMRRREESWKVMEQVRKCLWAMGYNLEVRIVRVGRPDKELVVSDRERKEKSVKRILGKRAADWTPLKMWDWLGASRLEK